MVGSHTEKIATSNYCPGFETTLALIAWNPDLKTTVTKLILTVRPYHLYIAFGGGFFGRNFPFSKSHGRVEHSKFHQSFEPKVAKCINLPNVMVNVLNGWKLWLSQQGQMSRKCQTFQFFEFFSPLQCYGRVAHSKFHQSFEPKVAKSRNLLVSMVHLLNGWKFWVNHQGQRLGGRIDFYHI